MGVVMKIELTQGLYALVDAEDYEKLNKHSWHASWSGRAWYAKSRIGERYVFMHRLIMNTSQDIDHIDNDGLNNQRHNLRPISQSNNSARAGPPFRRNKKTSKYKGVSWHTNAGKWTAHIQKGKEQFYLGLFDTEKDAAKAYNEKAHELFGEYAFLNKLDG